MFSKLGVPLTLLSEGGGVGGEMEIGSTAGKVVVEHTISIVVGIIVGSIGGGFADRVEVC